MPKLKRPDGRIVSVSEKGVEALRARGYTDPDGTAAPAADGDEAPAKSATRQEWDDYARTQGVDPGEYSSKDDLIDALE